MAKARAIVKRRKAVRNIRKITKTMQMIATAKFQKSLKRAVGAKAYTRKIRELVADLASTLGEIQHPLLRRPEGQAATKKVGLIVITSNRGLAGAYNGSVLRAASAFIRQQEAAGNSVELYISGKKGVTFFNFQRRPIAQRYEQFADQPRYADVDGVAEFFMKKFIDGQLDSVHVAYVNFISAGQQKPEVMTLLPLGQIAAESKPGTAEAKAAAGGPPAGAGTKVIYDFSPSATALLDELLPQTVKTALFQAFLDATTSENVARMVAMKSATDNANKMVKSLTMQYNRARQSQITTELSEIMGGVEAMSG